MTPLLACTGYLQAGEARQAVVRLLIERKADMEFAGNVSRPLVSACAHGHVGMARLLIQQKALIDNGNEFAGGPLHMACQYGQSAIALLLLDEHGVSCNTSLDVSDNTPLHIACYSGHMAFARLLLDRLLAKLRTLEQLNAYTTLQEMRSDDIQSTNFRV